MKSNYVISVLQLMDSEESDDLWKSCDSSTSDYLQLMQSLNLHEEDKEELQMLASLRREQEEDEYAASRLSGLQIQECNISTSPGAPPWTPISMVCICSTPLLSFNVILQWIQPVQLLDNLPSFAGFLFFQLWPELVLVTLVKPLFG